MALEALKLLLGIESTVHHRLHLWDGKRGEWRNVAIGTDPDCPECQAAPGNHAWPARLTRACRAGACGQADQ